MRDGLALLPPLLADAAIQEITDHLATQRLKLKDGTLVPASGVRAGEPIGDYPLSVVLNAPHVLELANDPLLIRLATAYIGCAPTISSIGLRWSFPAPVHASDVQNFHRDPDDWRFFKFFAYLTNVDADSGPHVFIRSSHKQSGRLFARPYAERDLIRRYGPDNVMTVSGARGTMFVADTYGIHKGAVPKRSPRLLLEVGYSLLPIYAFHYAPERLTRPRPALDPYINRLIVAA